MFVSGRVANAIRIGVLIAVWPFLSGIGKADKFRVGIYDLKQHDISMHWKNAEGKPYITLAAVKKKLEAEGKTVLGLTNAGIYGKDYAPLGWFVQNGKVLRRVNKSRGGGNFFLKPNGIFYIDKNGARVVRTRKLNRNIKALWATQSGPLLFDQSGIHPRFRKSSKSKYVRNAVGVRHDGKIVFVISRVPVTFWEIAQYMKTKLKCKSALYLDGSISQMWRAGEKVPVPFAPFVGIIAVTKKKS